jgi:hypothetical protein
MPKCEFCGKEHDDSSFELYATAERRTSDSFESWIQSIRQVCEHCLHRIVGDGVNVGSHVYCCAHCALLATPANGKVV